MGGLPGISIVEIINHFFDALQKQFNIARKVLKLQIAHAAGFVVSLHKEVFFHRIKYFVIAKLVRTFCENVTAKAVDCSHKHRIQPSNALAVQCACNARTHRIRSLVCKSECHNIFRFNIRFFLQDICDSARNDFGFPRAGTCNNLQILI